MAAPSGGGGGGDPPGAAGGRGGSRGAGEGWREGWGGEGEEPIARRLRNERPRCPPPRKRNHLETPRRLGACGACADGSVADSSGSPPPPRLAPDLSLALFVRLPAASLPFSRPGTARLEKGVERAVGRRL